MSGIKPETPADAKAVIAYLDKKFGDASEPSITFLPSSKYGAPAFNGSINAFPDPYEILRKLEQIFGKLSMLDNTTENPQKRINFQLIGQPLLLLEKIAENDRGYNPEPESAKALGV